MEINVLRGLGFAKPRLDELALQAARNGTTVEAELLATGDISEQAYYGAIARAVRLQFVSEISTDKVNDSDVIDAQLIQPNQLRIQHRHRSPQVAIVPEARRLPDLMAALDRLPDLARGLVITTPSVIRRAAWQAGAKRRVKAAVLALFDSRPDYSARIVAEGRQGFIGGVLLTVLLFVLWLKTETLLPLAHVVLSLTYLCSLILRIAALVRQKREAPRRFVEPHGPFPIYTVMVALYREAGMIPQLVASLERLEWPRSRLDIKLVCEADDLETLEAIRALSLPPHFEVVEVPPYHPRTKPKALTYALAGVRGEFVTIYDAEDRPHPKQLLEAYGRFQSAGPELVCLQSPLIISNMRASFISSLFAVEYAALFRGLLPMLGRYRLPMPLGGTSNHFRTNVLRKVGGWDPFNVTEDADLGLRLYRMGYRADTLGYHTLEDAPTELRIWTGQRIRWFKGWLQTWLVMMRRPLSLTREMGWAGCLTFHLLIGGMLASALLHPLILLFFISAGITFSNQTVAIIPQEVLALFILDTTNLIGSYAVFLGLGVGSMIDHEKRMIGWRWAAVPMHWLMVSYAAWRAVNELRTNPFFWKKTPHSPSKKDSADPTTPPA